MNISRSQLYDLVWRRSIVSLAKEYGFSDVGFSKICRRNNIPLPPRGYWAKISAGLKVYQPPLPNPHQELSVYIPLRTSITDEKILEKNKLLAQEKEELKKIGVLYVPDQPESQHKFSVNTQRHFDRIIKQIQQSKKSKSLPTNYYSVLNSIYRGRLQCKQDGCFNVAVSESLVGRALNFLDTLVKELEKNGFKLQAVKDNKSKGVVVAIKDNEVIFFSISEGYKYESIVDFQERSELEKLLYPNKMPVATGKLTFSVNAAETRLGRNWTDGKRNIELELAVIIREFITLVPRQKQTRMDALARQALRNEEARIFREKESQRYFEQSIYDEALKESESFKLYKGLEIYLSHLEAQYLEKYGTFSEQALTWFSTVRKVASMKNPASKRLRILIGN